MCHKLDLWLSLETGKVLGDSYLPGVAPPGGTIPFSLLKVGNLSPET